MSSAGVPTADPQRAFVEHLPIIDRVIGAIARRHALSTHDADEFASWAKSRIIDSEYAVFRKFGGRSSMVTYLSAVLAHLFLDYRNSIWGRWRPSAAALRLGPVAIRLEELLYRDGYSLREACEVLRSSGLSLTDAEFGRICSGLPMRLPASEVPLEAVEGTAQETERASTDLFTDTDGFRMLRDAIAELPDEDQVIMRMRFWEDLSTAEIARALSVEQKPLYRRITAIEIALRARLSAGGVDRNRARDLLSNEVVW